MGVLSKAPKLLCMHLQRRDDEISQCTKSVRCDHNMHRMDDAVVDIYAINLQLGAMAVCTGDIIPFTLSVDVRACLRASDEIDRPDFAQ